MINVIQMLMLFDTGSATSILVNAGGTKTVRTPTKNYAIISAAEREALGTLYDIARASSKCVMKSVVFIPILVDHIVLSERVFCTNVILPMIAISTLCARGLLWADEFLLREDVVTVHDMSYTRTRAHNYFYRIE